MQINRLFEMIYILLDKKTITAKELAQQFEVSVRTIYRDIDILSAGGIPIYTNKGKGGGISLMDDFVLNKSMLSATEQNEILMSLQSLHAVKVPEIDKVLTKLRTIFNKQVINWIDVDFSHWGSNDSEREKFDILKAGILRATIVSFDYCSSDGEKNKRIVEPVKLVFKGRSWYLYGYCQTKGGFRIFKITRIKNIHSSTEEFTRKISDDIWGEPQQSYNEGMITLILRIDARMEYRVYDEFDQDLIVKNTDGSFTVSVTFPENEWVYGYVLSYGNYAEVLEPQHIREIVKKKFQDGLQRYL